MFPAKIAVVVAGLVLALTVFVYQATVGSLTRSVTDGTTAQVERAAGLFLGQSRLQALEFTNEVSQYARVESLQRVFTLTDETTRRSAAHEAVNALNDDQIAKGHDRRAALVAIVDATGKVVARDLNINSMYGEDLRAAHPAVATALSGTANKDIWEFNHRMYWVACAPIRGTDGKIVGALVVGFEESGHDAQVLRDGFGTEAVLFLDGKIYASSFGEESSEEQTLAKVLFAGPELAGPALKERRQTAPFRVALHGESFVAVAAPLLGNTSHPPAGFVVLSSVDQALLPVGRVGAGVVILGLLAMLIAAATAMFTARSFLVPLDEIEQGVAEIINGNRDYIFEKGSQVYEGLENGLNVMIARLLGRPDPSENGEAMPASMDSVETSETPAQQVTTAISGENQELAREPEDRYLRRLYDEYVNAREQTGEGTKDLNFQGFSQKLKDNEVLLAKKYGTRLVRFKVMIKQGQVTLKPVPIP